jgi:hypothetical protein
MVLGLSCSFALMVPGVFAYVVVDNSPDGTGVATVTSNFGNKFGSLTIGDRFTLSHEAAITGGAIFSNRNFGSEGDLVRFVILPDAADRPGGVPVIDVLAVLDAVDTTLTASDPELTRKHAPIPPQSLPAGKYWFYLSGYGAQLTQATGSYDNNAFYAGFDNNPDLEYGPYPRGDTFFVIESEVEPVTPQDLIAELVKTVKALHRQHGIQNSLDSKLDKVIKSLEKANVNSNKSAINVLNAFINSVEAQRGKHIDEADADALIATAQAVIDSLSE